MHKNTEQPFKSGFISIIGRPNVGKSTLLNSIMGEKLVITANKPQTTRNAIRCIHTDADSQMVFIDTPGMHKPKNKLGDFMLKSAEDTISDVDVVLFLVEPEDRIGPGDQYILDKLAGSRTPVILIINKIDTVPKEELLKTIGAYQDYTFLDSIIPVSAWNGDGVQELLAAIKKHLEPGPMYLFLCSKYDFTHKFIL